ncbi:hypothetical protein PUNSTDRAFT_137882 [Punctularia strigosozonata HHB-11173 SS5]|uniref:Extracellular membrane protein CFEM domain-containing protein n=1 Tax=Punctularia strigosozonata (strain HHB-11173) TaxID=741275 RepID=R7S493_PUNST|nr:uncharacterized protein PUNSTDRAFT_137882 [Punctularia strigosozonata HHB-11173 SS5]EIN05200.1 hypothetical protein PUNSTDRAFT_137882 [Punctularia strigosozonata HHB-11173 SS5]
MLRSIVTLAVAVVALAGFSIAAPQECDPLTDPSCPLSCIGEGKLCTTMGTATCCPGTICQTILPEMIGDVDIGFCASA